MPVYLFKGFCNVPHPIAQRIKNKKRKKGKKNNKWCQKKGTIQGYWRSIQRYSDLYPMMIISIWMGIVSSRMTMPLPTGHKGFLNTLMSLKMISPSQSPELNQTEHLWEILDWCVGQWSHYHQLRLYLLEELCSWDVESIPRCIVSSYWLNTLLRLFLDVLYS